ncbi:tyrosine recombinase XerD [Acrocarpospora phusangensis]|uniref:Tyrosine recombinase XerD n=1 Tax=Acrocarpospora phusangensis TaxID=1070424 RepID=A0A919QEI2_9ACTN|nr:tyrosine-type recombinase/integrase [Acrocarpospora phusangensis]GIH25905.1 tyrosine recombinase XerD [Acrocarpospora phusangensis]
MTVTVVPLRGRMTTPAEAAARLDAYLDRCALAANTVTAYRRQVRAYLAWLGEHLARHSDAFVDRVGAEAAAAAWQRTLLADAAPATVNQALAAVALLYEVGASMRIKVKNARNPRPAPEALTSGQEAALRRAADERGPRDSAIIAVLLGTGARVEEAALLRVPDVTAGTCLLRGKDGLVRAMPLPVAARDRMSAWLVARADLLAAQPRLADAAAAGDDGLWIGTRGVLTATGLTDVVRSCGTAAGLAGLRPYTLRHTFATRLREQGADPADIKELLGNKSLGSAVRYFR